MSRKTGSVARKLNINPNETSEWIRLVRATIREYGLKSRVSEDDLSIRVYKPEIKIIEDELFCVEDTETTLEYIFEGNVVYM